MPFLSPNSAEALKELENKGGRIFLGGGGQLAVSWLEVTLKVMTQCINSMCSSVVKEYAHIPTTYESKLTYLHSQWSLMGGGCTVAVSINCLQM